MKTGGLNVKSSRNVKWFQTVKFVEFDRDKLWKLPPEGTQRYNKYSLLYGIRFIGLCSSFECVTPNTQTNEWWREKNRRYVMTLNS